MQSFQLLESNMSKFKCRLNFIITTSNCVIPENIHTPPTEGRGGGFYKAKNLKKCTKLNWNFQRDGGGVLEKIPSVGEVWIFSGITQY